VAIPIYDANYDVFIFNSTDSGLKAPTMRQHFQKTEHAKVLCDNFNPHNKSNCVLYVNYTLHGHEIGYLLLSRNLKAGNDLLVPYQMKGIKEYMIENDHQHLEFKRWDSEDGALFTI
jgi:hypothetical protein